MTYLLLQESGGCGGRDGGEEGLRGWREALT